jgi:hypothetical protein
MKNQLTVVVLVAAIAAAVAFAFSRGDASKGEAASAPPASSESLRSVGTDSRPDFGALPPNHPPIGQSSAPAEAMHGSGAEPAAIAWTPPADWKTVPNPNAMRLATYRVPAAPGDADETEVSVSRAGGSVDANVHRWIGQFDEAGKDTRVEKTVRGFKVTVVDVSGTYLGGGMMPGGRSEPKKGWSFVGAIVETSSSVGGTSYFFKMTGPAATVRAARPRFDGMIDAITPAPEPK